MAIYPFLLVLFYSPQSQYFVGPSIQEWHGDEASCLTEATKRIGEPLQTTTYWEVEMMGPVPKVVAAICAPGAVATH